MNNFGTAVNHPATANVGALELTADELLDLIECVSAASGAASDPILYRLADLYRSLCRHKDEAAVECA